MDTQTTEGPLSAEAKSVRGVWEWLLGQLGLERRSLPFCCHQRQGPPYLCRLWVVVPSPEGVIQHVQVAREQADPETGFRSPLCPLMVFCVHSEPLRRGGRRSLVFSVIGVKTFHFA